MSDGGTDCRKPSPTKILANFPNSGKLSSAQFLLRIMPAETRRRKRLTESLATTSSSCTCALPEGATWSAKATLEVGFVPFNARRSRHVGDQSLKKIGAIVLPVGGRYRGFGSGSASLRVHIYIIPPPYTSRADSEPRDPRGIPPFPHKRGQVLDNVDFLV